MLRTTRVQRFLTIRKRLLWLLAFAFIETCFFLSFCLSQPLQYVLFLGKIANPKEYSFFLLSSVVVELLFVPQTLFPFLHSIYFTMYMNLHVCVLVRVIMPRCIHITTITFPCQTSSAVSSTLQIYAILFSPHLLLSWPQIVSTAVQMRGTSSRNSFLIRGTPI